MEQRSLILVTNDSSGKIPKDATRTCTSCAVHIQCGVQVTIGEEGFFGPNDPNVKCNPGYSDGASWPAYEGQDFTNNHRSKDIDFTVRTTLPAFGRM